MRPNRQVHFSSTNTLYTFITQTPEASPLLPAKRPLVKDFTKVTKAPREKSRVYAAKENHDFQRHSRRLSLDSQLDQRRSTFLHFLLAPSSDPHIIYDVSLPPETLACRYPSSLLAEPATSPPVPILVIESPNCPWPITVIPSSSPSPLLLVYGAVVTVWDVLSAIHDALRPPVTLEEYHALPSLEATQRVNLAYSKRCKRIQGLEARMEEGLRGVRRVDFLGGATRFMGLATHTSAGHVWKLVVSA